MADYSTLIDDKFKLIDDLTAQNNAIPPEPNYEDYARRNENFNTQINNIKIELAELLKQQNPLYKRIFQMKLYGLI